MTRSSGFSCKSTTLYYKADIFFQTKRPDIHPICPWLWDIRLFFKRWCATKIPISKPVKRCKPTRAANVPGERKVLLSCWRCRVRYLEEDFVTRDAFTKEMRVSAENDVFPSLECLVKKITYIILYYEYKYTPWAPQTYIFIGFL